MSVPTAKQYTLYAPRIVAAFGKLLIFGLLGLFLLVGVWIILESLRTARSLIWVGLLWLVVVGYVAYTYLALPYTILWQDDGMIGFKSVLRTFIVAPNQIRSIVPESWPIGFLIVKTQRGKLRLPNQFNDFHEFLARLEAANPGVELRGC